MNLAIRHGEIVAYAGPNGAGKSTTVKLLSLVGATVVCMAAGAEVRVATCAEDSRLCPAATGLIHPHAPASDSHHTFSGGVSVGDFNRDGLQDLFQVTGGEGPDLSESGRRHLSGGR